MAFTRPEQLRPPAPGQLCRALLLVALAAASLPACGYRWLAPPAHLQQSCIAVLPFTETTPVGMAVPLAAELQRQLLAEGVALCGSTAAATAVLDGALTVVNRPSINPRAGGVGAWQVSATATATVRVGGGMPLWSGTVQASEDYLPAALPEQGPSVQPLLTESNRRTALLRLAETLAARLHERLMIPTDVDETVTPAAAPAVRPATTTPVKPTASPPVKPIAAPAVTL